jgi:hypothetical protein
MENLMNTLQLFLAKGVGLFGLGLATMTGCAALIGGGGGGTHRSDQFASGNAPEPTIATTVLSCVAKALPYGSGDAYTAQFNALARTAMPAAPVPLSPSATSVLCSTIAASDSFHAWAETTPAPSAAAVIRELAQATGAKAIAMPAMRLYARCEQDTRTVRDATGATVATIQENTQTCRMDRWKDVGLFLFSADGAVWYRSTKRAGISSNPDPEPQMNEVLAGIPATFSAPAGGAAAMAAAASPPMAAPAATAAPAAATPTPAGFAAPQGVGPQDPKIDSAIGEVAAQAPSDCKKYVKTVCRGVSLPDTSRLTMCSAYVRSINQVVQQQGAKAADACKAMLKSAPP